MPRGVMSPEVRRRACAERSVRREQMVRAREASSLSIGPYRVFRGDELNWFVARPGYETGYYPTLPAALTALLRVRIGDRAAGSICEVLRAVQLAEAEILEAVTARTFSEPQGRCAGDAPTRRKPDHP